MNKFKTKKLIDNNFLYIILLLFCISLFVFIPQIAMQSFFQGLRLWATKVLPALLPFFILVKLLSYTTFSQTIGNFLSPITYRFYRVGGIAGYIYIMSILSGYPVGAKLTADFYKENYISKRQAHTISAFTSTSGPLFVLGTVGIGLFTSQKLGIIVLISHYISAILNGLLYKYKDKPINKLNFTQKTTNTLSESMTSSIASILVVGGFIAIFYMILSLLLHIQAFKLPTYLFSLIGIPNEITIAIISGIIEVTTGATLLAKCAISFKLQALIVSFLISFGGLSIHAQAYCFLKDINMPYSKFLLQKFTHATLSLIITSIILYL